MTAPTSQRTGGGISYTLTRKKVKNINLRVRGDGSVWVSASPRVPLAQIDRFVADHGLWIAQAREKAQTRRENRMAQPLPEPGQALAEMEAICREFYPYFQKVLPQGMPRIIIKDISSSWGICRPGKGEITFALRLAAQPRAAREYVAVHEYCHFLVPNHSPAFWEEVEKILPDWKERRALLP